MNKDSFKLFALFVSELYLPGSVWGGLVNFIPAMKNKLFNACMSRSVNNKIMGGRDEFVQHESTREQLQDV